MRGSHGGYATAAKRRGEQWLGCNTCGQPHRRFPVTQPDETPGDFWRALAVALLLVVAGYALVIAVAGYAT